MLLLAGAAAQADAYEDAIKAFRDAGQSGMFFGKSHGYAVFPTAGKAGVGGSAARTARDACTWAASTSATRR